MRPNKGRTITSTKPILRTAALPNTRRRRSLADRNSNVWAPHGPAVHTVRRPAREAARENASAAVHYKNILKMQALRVVDVAISERLQADKRVAAAAAAISREEQRAEDRATCAAAIRNRKSERTANERAAGWETFVAEDTDHVGKLGPTTDKRENWKKIARKPVLVREDRSWEIQIGRGGSTRLRSGRHREEHCRRVRQAHCHRDRLNFSKARAKRPRAQDNRQDNTLET